LPRQLLQVSLPVSPSWDAIERIRGSVLACVNVNFHPALAARMGIVAGELMENAVKYGSWRDGRGGAFSLRLCEGEDRLAIEVACPTGDGDPNVERLREELERIACSPSPEEAFLRGVRGVALQRHKGLGLARIAHEGGCDLEAECVGVTLVVRAVTRSLHDELPTPAAAM
jgi:anti-sigma regulatory factor (Ser/Thr protein kinase)